MDATDENDSEQSRLWNGSSGHAWVDAQALLDEMFRPFEHLLVEAALARSPRHVLDIGCGTGSTTLAVARGLGKSVRCVGLDISDPMLTLARARADRDGSQAEFIRADAQTFAFEPASFDLILSRFGVMFFADPVAAFANLRRATSGNGALRLIVWRAAADNPFMTAAERVAAPLLPNLPTRSPDGPGQFAFADAAQVHAILEQGGWTGIDIKPLDLECAFPVRELDSYLTRLGPMGRVLQDADDHTRARMLAAIRPAFDTYIRGTDVRFVAACWMLSAG